MSLSSTPSTAGFITVEVSTRSIAVSPADRWVITTLLKFVGHGDWTGYPPDGRERIVAALMRSLRPLCADLEYGGDNGVAFYPVTDEMIAEIEGSARAEE